MRPLSPRESRLVAVLVLIAMVLFAVTFIVAPLVGGFADRAAERRELATRYAANERVIASIPRLAREARARERQLGDYALAAGDAGTASELLRDRLQAAVAAVGGDFRGAEDIAGPPGTAAARISARLTSAQVSPLLASLQNARPFLTITGLALGANDALLTGREATLDVQIEAAIPFRPAAAR